MPITHYFDWFAIVLAALFIAFAAKRGLVEELFGAAALIGGFIGAFFTYPIVFERLGFIMVSAQLRTLFAFFIAYALIALIVILLGFIVKKVIQISMLGWVDHILGGFIGLLKAAVALSVIVILIHSQPSKQLQKQFSGSFVYALCTKLPFTIRIPTSAMINQGEQLLHAMSPASIHMPDMKHILSTTPESSAAEISAADSSSSFTKSQNSTSSEKKAKANPTHD